MIIKEKYSSQEWFVVCNITPRLLAITEPHHVERTIANLIVGDEKAILIDTGCGIGNLRELVEKLTEKSIVVINTHTHPDHIGSNNQFDEIMLFDHPKARKIAENGVSYDVLQSEILDEKLITKPWPDGFDPERFEIQPFMVNRWLQDGEQIDIGGIQLEVIYTPGEAVDHICLLDRANRILFCGDILLQGEIWTHLEGGSLQDLISSYKRLLNYMG